MSSGWYRLPWPCDISTGELHLHSSELQLHDHSFLRARINYAVNTLLFLQLSFRLSHAQLTISRCMMSVITRPSGCSGRGHPLNNNTLNVNQKTQVMIMVMNSRIINWRNAKTMLGKYTLVFLLLLIYTRTVENYFMPNFSIDFNGHCI